MPTMLQLKKLLHDLSICTTGNIQYNENDQHSLTCNVHCLFHCEIILTSQSCAKGSHSHTYLNGVPQMLQYP